MLLPANFLMLCRDPLDGFSVLIHITWILLRSDCSLEYDPVQCRQLVPVSSLVLG